WPSAAMDGWIFPTIGVYLTSLLNTDLSSILYCLQPPQSSPDLLHPLCALLVEQEFFSCRVSINLTRIAVQWE
ncbi:hypothetical protein COT48_06385, partial [Candidatus Woesearchaeota archaeon CG08_land_8_20_14_0_20_47_9]